MRAGDEAVVAPSGEPIVFEEMAPPPGVPSGIAAAQAEGMRRQAYLVAAQQLSQLLTWAEADPNVNPDLSQSAKVLYRQLLAAAAKTVTV